jgi:hypothetical protein
MATLALMGGTLGGHELSACSLSHFATLQLSACAAESLAPPAGPPTGDPTLQSGNPLRAAASACQPAFPRPAPL